ncbi:MAG: family 78 glycoside hydrolase catalytic domain [Tepidisphaeraceae bacterium]
MRIENLRCERRIHPIDLDTPTPTFSWTLADPATHGQRQTAYRILVASTAEHLANDTADLWDSGRVESNDTLNVTYAGTRLVSRQQAFWTVQAWDKDGVATPRSEPAAFAIALLSPGDWHAKWIGHDTTGQADALPLFRRQFAVSKPVRRAVLYICGLGHFELRCNGKRVSEDLLQPGWTNYRKTCQYVAHDISASIKQGENALGVLLGHGMYHSGDAPAGTKRYTKFKGSFGPPVLIAQLHLDYTDGTAETIITDTHWQTHAGPITYSNIYGGEDYDARLHQPGWDTANFDASAWKPAIFRDGPGGTLRGSSHFSPPVRIEKRLDTSPRYGPADANGLPTNLGVYDAGQNCSMIPRIVARGTAGSSVKISPGESLKDDGTVNQKHTGSPVFYSYTLRGDGDESWSPRFAYTGGRYLQIELTPPPGQETPLTPPMVQSLHITAAGQPVGHFECSNDLFNRTAGLIDWAIRSNTVSVFTDCPHREKLGWLEQQHLVGPSLMYRYDFAAHFAKAAADHTDAQLPNGDVPTICPQYTQFKSPWDVFNDSPEWGSSSVLVPWQVYKWYGDIALLRRQYPTMTRYVEYLKSRSDNHIVSHGLGDWYDLGPNPPGFTQLTPKELTATAIYFHDAEVLSQAAAVLGHDADAKEYATLAGRIRDAFNAKFYDAGTHQYATKSQTSLAMPLALSLVPEDDRAAVLENLVAEIRGRDNALTAGDVGYRFLLNALAQAGRDDVIFDMNSRSDRPGYGMMLARGETSLTEAWDARPQSSLNHFMLGHLQEWLYARLAGIRQADESVGFSRIVIEPTPVGDITHAKAAHDSVRGRISVEWSITNGAITVDCEIPPNTTGEVRVAGGRYEITSSRHRFSTGLK